MTSMQNSITIVLRVENTVKSAISYLPLSKESTSALESVCGFPARALRNSFGLPNM